jgi:hypothetical protein
VMTNAENRPSSGESSTEPGNFADQQRGEDCRVITAWVAASGTQQVLMLHLTPLKNVWRKNVPESHTKEINDCLSRLPEHVCIAMRVTMAIKKP